MWSMSLHVLVSTNTWVLVEQIWSSRSDYDRLLNIEMLLGFQYNFLKKFS